MGDRVDEGQLLARLELVKTTIDIVADRSYVTGAGRAKPPLDR